MEWLFLKQSMLELGFAQSWVNLIMMCITTSSLAVIVNGTTKGLIYPHRGLRQSCLISPYLYIMCVEVFSVILQRA